MRRRVMRRRVRRRGLGSHGTRLIEADEQAPEGEQMTRYFLASKEHEVYIGQVGSAWDVLPGLRAA
jgi:hypothetical protein